MPRKPCDPDKSAVIPALVWIGTVLYLMALVQWVGL